MNFDEIFKAKGGDRYNRFPAGAPNSTGGQFAPKTSGGTGVGGKKSFFDSFAQVLADKQPSLPSVSTGGNATVPVKSSYFGENSFSGSKPPQSSMFGQSTFGQGSYQPKPFSPPKGAKPHPSVNDKGQPVTINYPSKPSPIETWKDKSATVTVTPGSPVPKSMYGVTFAPWKDVPQTPDAWNKVDGQNHAVDGHIPFEAHPTKHTGAGVLVVEKDGRIWMTKPTNEFGGYQHTFPKGTVEDGINLQASAIKEAYEETGLKVKITGLLGDFERSTSKARYYLAQRVGGTPSNMGWESQAMRLANFKNSRKLLNNQVDKDILDALEDEMNIGKSIDLSVRAAQLLVRLQGVGDE
jgi:ADP-ribose pyrophosphatase YjhB (NUDIX family)